MRGALSRDLYLVAYLGIISKCIILYKSKFIIT
jgi:hypothetical protein